MMRFKRFLTVLTAAMLLVSLAGTAVLAAVKDTLVIRALADQKTFLWQCDASASFSQNQLAPQINKDRV